MTKEAMREVCVRELLFHEQFLVDYKTELSSLHNDPSFMEIIRSISNEVLPEIEFSENAFNPNFTCFKKKTISNRMFDLNAYHDYADYKSIVDDVKGKKQTKLSATISIYYAMRYLDFAGIGESTLSEVLACAENAFKDYTVSDADYRKKWPAKARCDDGHYVRSKNEQLVDNWLYYHGICHAYEKLVVDRESKREFICDFFLQKYNTYIEVWGMESEEYLKRKNEKILVYKRNGLKLLQMTESEVKILDDYMRRNLSV